ncbi:MAG: ABC transporter permease subunit [Abitibacteriaceae bacterium]|nr:ABC transporter permease subunit [Abditibacteriaceae bacterium]
MEAPYLAGTNPVLTRELRVSLRTARTFLLLAVYVAILGAIVVSQFPSDTALYVGRSGAAVADMGQTAAQRGKSLYWSFCEAQALLVLVLFPALATGMLAQERERRTLEPLLLTPLTPLQIVWGKAGGVLSLAVLLLLSTLPLTSLCFLLGGVSPQELISAYAALSGLALLTISLGLYCSAKWTNTTRATLYSYLFLPFLLPFVVIFAGVGMFVAGLYFSLGIFYKFFQLWKYWGKAPLPQRFKVGWWLLFGILAAALSYYLLALLTNKDASIVFLSLCITSYLVYTSIWVCSKRRAKWLNAPIRWHPCQSGFTTLKRSGSVLSLLHQWFICPRPLANTPIHHKPLPLLPKPHPPLMACSPFCRMA